MTVANDTTLEAPYLGLRYFDEEQSHLFFGREAQASDILEKLRRSRLVTVMGSSGSGKSSLVRAGMIPTLKAGFLDDAGPRWLIAKMRPGGSPISNLARELEKALSVRDVEVTIRRGPLGLIQAVEECRLPARDNVLVIADQFEELFRYQRESEHAEAAKEEAAAFVKLLLEAANQRAVPIYVIVTMRSDYLGNCAQFRDLPEHINEGLYLVPRMRRDQLEQAITGPVAVEDVEITPRLVQKLLNDTGDDPDQLPVLQHVLLRAWNAWHHAPRPIDLEDLDAVGGMKESLSRHANEIFDRLSADQQRIARVVFQQLSDRDAEGREVRRPAPMAHIAAVAGVTVTAVEEVVEKFGAPEAALLYRNEDGHLDITHESLIRKWDRIQGRRDDAGGAKGWMQEEVDARDQFQLLIERTRKRDTLRGRGLEEALAWRALGLSREWARRYTRTREAETSFWDVLGFVEECRKKDVRRRVVKTSLITGGLAAAAIFIAVIVALWRSAERQTRTARVALAQTSAQEAIRLMAASQPDIALAHLARALRSDPDSIAARGWLSSLMLNQTLWVAGAPLTHEDSIIAAAFSPDGRRVVTASYDNTARIWDAATGRPVGAILQHENRVTDAALSPDGRRIITASLDRTARVWDATTGQPLGPTLQHPDAVVMAAFSRDGRRIVTGSYDKTARVWDASTGQPFGQPLPHEGIVTGENFSPDARRVVLFRGETARVWDVDTNKPVDVPIQTGDVVIAAAFSPDGRRVLITSQDGNTRVFDGATNQLVGANLRHPGVQRAAFSPDGSRVVTASTDGTARIWEAETGQPVGVPLQHPQAVSLAAFSPDGRRIVTVSGGSVRAWDAATGLPVGALFRVGDVTAAAFSPDGRRILTATQDTFVGRKMSALVWDARVIGQAVGMPLQHQGSVAAVAFSPDGRRIVTGSSDDAARIWDAATGQPVGAPLQHQGAVTAVAFSPDGRRVVTTSRDVARIWDAATGQPVGAPLQNGDSVTAVAFSPDGHRVTGASRYGTHVWDSVSGKPAARLDLQHSKVTTHAVTAAAFSANGGHIVTVVEDTVANAARVFNATTGEPVNDSFTHQGGVTATALSPDGRRVVTASRDSARIWDAATGQPVGAPLQHEGAVTAVAFSFDGLRVVTASDDNTARIWDAATGQPVGAPLRHQGHVLAVAFSPDGRRVVTASNDHSARVWQVLLDFSSSEIFELLPDLAEVQGGYRVTSLGSVARLGEGERDERVHRINGVASGVVPAEVLLRRFLGSSQ